MKREAPPLDEDLIPPTREQSMVEIAIANGLPSKICAACHKQPLGPTDLLDYLCNTCGKVPQDS
ncbi:MAG TPA: hypothetical protein V6D29_04765 [Leptolyngbyaceae cyanobacterium]